MTSTQLTQGDRSEVLKDFHVQAKAMEKVMRDGEQTMRKYERALNLVQGGVSKPQRTTQSIDDKRLGRVQKALEEVLELCTRADTAVSNAMDGAKKLQRAQSGGMASKQPSSSGHDHIAREGELVAAKDPRTKSWILAKTLHLLLAKGKYEVEDADPSLDSMSVRRSFTVATSDVLALAHAAETVLAPGTPVMAQFPETSTFYPAVVVSIPAHNAQHRNHYVLRFNDDEDDTGRTPLRHVHVDYVVRKPDSVVIEPEEEG